MNEYVVATVAACAEECAAWATCAAKAPAAVPTASGSVSPAPGTTGKGGELGSPVKKWESFSTPSTTRNDAPKGIRTHQVSQRPRGVPKPRAEIRSSQRM